MALKPKTKNLVIRVDPQTHKAFHVKARTYGTVSEVYRELVNAFIEGRLTITPPSNRKESLYK
jgi:hypothetical protein